MLLTLLFITFTYSVNIPRNPKTLYDLQAFEEKDDKMSEMYSLDRQVQILQIKVKEVELEILSLKDELKEQINASTKNAAQLRLNFLQKELALLKKDLHENAQDAIKFYGKMGGNIQTEYNGIYNYQKRIAELRSL
ncbi:hypothetical protein ENUP19_0126G0034 [Entamoeba nuttalli]|uniref:Uncharacterized protein n=2 Tax=Entamoeba nuttalli TaxID=412467 RepID=K2HB82_ENTNP|nr:hypothetical protein ENU1_109290 [Entamoeba nuttalli P19]EKE39934.1 hypothetical protein ENU1_109290 [Entamoeba nuttalli P19]|eukprot:XP_008857730.1 hypothetical protein ENU1_109290 [Entamoeba nuttalli P19]